mgnify:CR=1 FL=1
MVRWGRSHRRRGAHDLGVREAAQRGTCEAHAPLCADAAAGGGASGLGDGERGEGGAACALHCRMPRMASEGHAYCAQPRTATDFGARPRLGTERVQQP